MNNSAFKGIIRFHQDHLADVATILAQYENLRGCFNEITREVLGEDYYNEGHDVYSCDVFACRDILKRVREKESWLDRLFRKN